MSDDEAEPTAFSYVSDEAQQARSVIAKAVQDYLTLMRPTESPYAVAWVVGVEWTNTDLEQTGRAGRDTISPSEQTISATVGLGQYIAVRYS